VGTSKQLFLEFQTSQEGPFLGTGFDLRVGHLPGNPSHFYTDKSRGGGGGGGDTSCYRVFESKSMGGQQEGLFLSLEHWYPPGTNCTFLIKGKPNEVARLTFPSFKIRQETHVCN
jgi:hypothetical protein